MSLTAYRALGRSGLAVSPLALGTMTFGNSAWGSADTVSRSIFDAYVEAGGNFVDTADVYSGGRSEELLGGFIAERSLRDKVVLATKCGFNAEPGNPHAGGNGAKNIHRALDASLKRLHTDYIDLYWTHVYDMVTPIEEVLQTLSDLVRSGKIRYFGFSNIPAWCAVRAATLAQARGVPGPIALQMEYSLVARGIESEHVPGAVECGLGIVPWSPLAGGFLAGKYAREGQGAAGQGRLGGANPFQGQFTKFTEHNWYVLDALTAVSAELDRPPAQVALAWAAAQPGIASLLLGASRIEQLHGNLGSLEVSLSPEQIKRLDGASALDQAFFTPQLQRMIFGGAAVQRWR